MSRLTDLEILAIASSENFPTRLVFFTTAIESNELAMAAVGEAYGMTLKDAAPETLLQSLRQVVDGQRLLPLLPFDQVPRLQTKKAISEIALNVLTDRERQIMRLVSAGLSNKAVGRRLNIADGTIKQHLHHIYQKLAIDNRTVLAALAISLDDRGGVAEDDQAPGYSSRAAVRAALRSPSNASGLELSRATSPGGAMIIARARIRSSN